MDNPYTEKFRTLCNTIAKDLVERKMLMEAGVRVLLTMNLPENHDEAMRFAFFAGADHIFSVMMNNIDDGPSPGQEEIILMSRIHDELENWRKTALAVTGITPGGRA